MKKTATLFFIIVLLAAGCDDYPSREDIPIIIEDAVADYDGNHYDAVHIGNKVWMAENLRTTHYADGKEIPAGNDAISDSIPYRYAPDDNENNVEKCGYLYNSPAVMDGKPASNADPSGVQGICPDGWHVPSIQEWRYLKSALSYRSIYIGEGGEYDDIAKSMASTEGWETSTAGPGYDQLHNNTSRFNARPTGYRNAGGFCYYGVKTRFCSSSFNSSALRYAVLIDNDKTKLMESTAPNENGYSVRCVKD